ncbi:hypothetical protein [Nocardia sp. NPDC050175]|uniref:hypothetical protein n=1 Tax=Nocardia sp. NPDC050175 TaxID=3364317 RepID=UPI0037A39468
MKRLPVALAATIHYEALLTTRQRVLWLSLLPLCALIMLLVEFPHGHNRTDDIAAIGDTALLINFLGSIGIAIALADRLAVQCRPGVRELFGATPAGRHMRSAGILLGPWLIVSAPTSLVLMVMGLWLSVTGSSVRPLAAAAIGLTTIVLPGSLLLTALANLMSLLLPGAVARVLIVPFWYWATALTPLIPVPTVARTVLSPLGDYQAAQWLNVALPQATGGWPHPTAGPTAALVSLSITIGTTVLAFLIGHQLLAKSR